MKEFLDALDDKMRAKLLRTVYLLEQNGNDLREPYSKHLDDGRSPKQLFLFKSGEADPAAHAHR